VSDPAEAQREPVRQTRLFERWSKRAEGACPFGIVLRPAIDAAGANPPFPTWTYHPAYLPPHLAIQVAVDTPLSEPELFYLAFSRPRDAAEQEPFTHSLPATEITGLAIGLPGVKPRSLAAHTVEAMGLVSFSAADDYVMVLTLDRGARSRAADLRPGLPLILRW
jgi:hypothetical protein